MHIKVLIVDDHQIMREGLASLLEEISGVEVVGQASTGMEATTLARKLKPDVIIMDVAMYDLNGVEATRHIVNDVPGCKVIGLSMHAERQFVVGMLKAGASGYLIKGCSFSELSQAIKIVYQGGTYLAPSVSTVVLEEVQSPGQHEGENLVYKLSAREREILQYIAEAHTSKEIAEILNLSVKTVQAHRNNIMAKLKAKNLSELTRIAIREGISPLP